MKTWFHKEGCRGQEVSRIQGVLSITEDGIFGPSTKAAVEKIQSSHSLSVDGVVGPATRKEMEIEIFSGIDISKWNDITDWGILKASGMAEFCWIKSTEGNNYLCPMFKEHSKNASASGIPWGSYHFARPDLHKEPYEEVKNFVRYCPIKEGNLRPVLDFERAGDHDPDSIRKWVLGFLQEFESTTGIRPIIYTGGNMTKYYLNGDTTGVDKYTLWHAYYSKKALERGIKKDRLGGWPSWRVWQWTGSGQLPGAAADIDRNWLVGGRQGFDEILIK